MNPEDYWSGQKKGNIFLRTRSSGPTGLWPIESVKVLKRSIFRYNSIKVTCYLYEKAHLLPRFLIYRLGTPIPKTIKKRKDLIWNSETKSTSSSTPLDNTSWPRELGHDREKKTTETVNLVTYYPTSDSLRLDSILTVDSHPFQRIYDLPREIFNLKR